MSQAAAGATGFWKTVGLLLGFARRRARGRAERRQQLMGQRGSTDWTALATLVGVLVATLTHAMVAILLYGVVTSASLGVDTPDRRMVVSRLCLAAVETAERGRRENVGADVDGALRIIFEREAIRADPKHPFQHLARLEQHYKRYGRAGLTSGEWGFAAGDRRLGPIASLLGSLVLLLWFVAAAVQGEGVDLDFQRRRHPMWEWLLGHPVDARAVFLAEMLSPLAANPVFWMAAVFWIGTFWFAYDSFATGLAAGLAAGIPLGIAAGCAGKAVEIVALLRLPPRSRGAVLGIVAWFGQAVFVLMLFGVMFKPLVPAVVRFVSQNGPGLSLPFLGWAVGLGGTPSPWKGVAACWLAASGLVALAVQVSARATRQGLAGAFGDSAPARVSVTPRRRAPRVRRDPLYRKELLWLWRDRGAVVQVFLIPLTMAAVQLFNFRGILTHSTAGWHLIAGAAVVFGSYFLFILGPRSLASEGQALWMALTWPRGLEELLRAKARLWWMVSLVVVGLVLLFAVLRYPADAWRVGIVGVLWGVFGRSLAEKAVTLVNAPSTSGEPEPVPRGRQWAASLGTFTFGAGILSQRWHLAVVGIVYSWLTAAAMWQQFRARLPYLFDPWAEPAPKIPSLVNAMVAIAALTEGMAVMLAILLGVLGPQRLFIAQFVAYGICGLVAWLVTSSWLDGRGVDTKDIWRWPDVPRGARRLLLGGAVGLGLGAALGLAGIAWGALVQRIPEWGPALRAAGEHLAAHPGERIFVAVGAIAFAPLAEEYLFRGLLFRALDREWGGARAIWGSACFFAIYHPPVAWPPVVLVGAAAAVLFRRTGHLLPAVILHATYNAIVVLAT